MKTRTVIVVSHIDLKAHQNAFELINIKDFENWRKPHHECRFTLNRDKTADQQMRDAVHKHARDYSLVYGLKEGGYFDIYPFTKSRYFSHRYRLSKEQNWKPRNNSKDYIFVSPSLITPKFGGLQIPPSYNLLVIKFFDRDAMTLNFVGTLAFFEHEIISTKLRHIRRLCNIKDHMVSIELFNVVSKGETYVITLNKTFNEQQLRTGSILHVQLFDYSSCIPIKGESQLKNRVPLPTYATHFYDKYATRSGVDPIIEGLYEQAKVGKYTDIVVSSKIERVEQLRLHAHKMVLATIPRFKATLENGMKESTSDTVLELEAPASATHESLRDLHEFIYLRNVEILTPESTAPIERLVELFRVADDYCVEELLGKISSTIPEKNYSYLTPEIALELLELLDHRLEFPEHHDLEIHVLGYMKYNFGLVGRCQRFGDMFGTKLYHKIIDAITTNRVAI